MQKSQILLTIAAICVVIGLFLLPKVVLDSSDDLAVEEEHSEDDGHDHSVPAGVEGSGTAHNQPISEEDEKKINSLREKYLISKDKEKSAKFADSLAIAYRTVAKYDSAAKYSEVVAQIFPVDENFIKAGDNYFDAFSYSVEPELMNFYGEKARVYYQKLLKSRPNLMDVKNKLAMTYVASSTPMQGILLLREILDADPVNEQALFNMGILSIQSRQYDKAIERLEKLVQLYPENLQGRFYLGVSYFETGQKQKAKDEFEVVKKQDSDPALQATVDTYLDEIK